MSVSDYLFLFLIGGTGLLHLANGYWLQKNEINIESSNGIMYFWIDILRYCFCTLIGFSARFVQDRKSSPKPDWLFQLISAIFVSYMAYLLYNFYRWTFLPIEVVIMLVSWMSAFLVTTGDYIARNGILSYFRKMLQELLALTKKRNDA